MPCNVLAFMSDHPPRVRRDFHCTRNFLLVSIVTLRPRPCQALDESWIGRERPPVRGGGNVASSPSASTWKSASASGRPDKRCRPRLRKRRPAGIDAPTAFVVSPERTI